MYFFCCYAGSFYMSWFPTYLLRAKGFAEKDLLLAVFPSIAGALAYLVGGYSHDILSRRWGFRWGPRIPALTGFGISTLSILMMMHAQDRLTTVACFTATAVGLSLILPSAWAVCVGMAGPAAGTLTGLMNTVGQIGSFLSTVLFGLLVSSSGSYEAPVITICVACALGGALWFGIDGSRVLKPAS
jgi:predicted MFS family arabinose efflux permease